MQTSVVIAAAEGVVDRANEPAREVVEPVVSLFNSFWAARLWEFRNSQGEATNVVTTEQLVFFASTTVLVFLLAFVLRTLTKRVIKLRRFAQGPVSTRTAQQALLAAVSKTSSFLLFFLSLYLGSLWLDLPEAKETTLGRLAFLVLLIQFGLYANEAIRVFISQSVRQKTEADPAAVTSSGVMSFAVRFLMWVLVLLLILQNWGYEISAVIAGLGVGGIAVAFALQNILGDIFNSVAIVLDRPFAVGDFIIAGDQMGVVEHIGIKSTRVRSLWGEQVVFPNADITSSRIRNYKRMEERRVLFAIGVVYETPVEKLERIPAIIREAVETTAMTRFDRAHFFSYGDFSLNFEVVYYVRASDYNLYMDIQQEINLKIFRRFAEEGISFAYPTQELVVRPVRLAQPPGASHYEEQKPDA
jgi:small-conductance mechanosensitive channel